MTTLPESSPSKEWESSNESAVPFDSITAKIKSQATQNTPRKRGRPPGSGKQNVASAASASPVLPESPSTSAATDPINAATAFSQLPDTKAAFKPLIKQGSQIAISRTGWQGWEIDDAETDMLAQNAEIVMKTLLPMLGTSPYTPAIVAGATIVGSIGIRYLGFRAWQKEERLKAAQAQQAAAAPQ